MIVANINEAHLYLVKNKPGKTIISFDLFDTVIKRAVPPEFIKQRTSVFLFNHLDKKTSADPQALYQARKLIEKSLEDNSETKGRDRDYDYVSCIHQWVKEFHPSPEESLIRQIIEFEINLEVQAIEIIPGSTRLLELANHTTNRVIYITDMYLPDHVIDKILKETGLSGYFHQGYISSQYFQRKDTGNLFKLVIEREGIDPSQILHIGDNPHSDYHIPHSLGIQSILIENKKEKQKYRDIDCLLADYIKDPPLSIPAYDAILKKSTEYILSDDISPAVREIAFSLAYVFIDFINRIINYCLDNGIGRVYFLAREGLFFKNIFDIINTHPIQSYYLYVSRQSLYPLSIQNLDETAIQSIVNDFRHHRKQHISLDQIIKISGLKHEQLAHIFSEFRINPRNMIPLDSETDLQLFVKILSDQRITQAFHQSQIQYIGLFTEYLAQNDFLSNDPSLIVDIGWKGTMLNILSDFMRTLYYQKHLHGYFFAYHQDTTSWKDPADTSKTGYFEMTDGEKRSTDSLFYNMTIEFIATSDHGTTTGYAYSKDGVTPIFNTNLREEKQYCTRIEKIQKVILEYAARYKIMRTLVPCSSSITDNSSYCRDLCLNFFSRPSYEIARYFSKFVLYDNFFGRYWIYHFYDVIWWAEAFRIICEKNIFYRYGIRIITAVKRNIRRSRRYAMKIKRMLT